MTAPMLWGSFGDLWSLYHKVTFDGIARRIYINPDVISLDVEADIYSSWKEWAQTYDNLKFLPAFRTTGGDPLPGGRRVGQYFFLTNGWKLVPPLDNSLSDIQLIGNLFADDGSDIFDLSGFNNFRLVRQVVSQFTEIAVPQINTDDITVIVTGSGLTADESAKLNNLVSLNQQQTSSLNLLLATSSTQTITLAGISAAQTTLGTSINDINLIVTSTSGSVGDIITSQSISYLQLVEQSSSLAQQNTILVQQSSSMALQTQLLQLQSASLAAQTQQLAIQSASLAQQSASLATIQQNTQDILSTGGTLTPEQSTMLLEMYRLLGLDPTRPLIVSPTVRTVGAEIDQTISKVGDTVTVTRI